MCTKAQDSKRTVLNASLHSMIMFTLRGNVKDGIDKLKQNDKMDVRFSNTFFKFHIMRNVDMERLSNLYARSYMG